MDTTDITPNLSMMRVKGWQVYVWRDADSVTLIDTGAPGSGAEILSAVPYVDHIGSAGELHETTGALVFAARTVASFHRLATLDVKTACFGHGEPIPSGAGDRIREVAATLMP